MKHKRHSVEQIVAAVKQHEQGTLALAPIFAVHWTGQWRSIDGGFELNEVCELKQRREEVDGIIRQTHGGL